MTVLLAIGGFLIIFAWAWMSIYRYNVKKGSRPLMGHMLGFLLGVFPAQFFMVAVFVSFPPPTLPPASTLSIVSLWAFFVISVIGIIYLTKRPIPPKDTSKTPIANNDKPLK